MAYEHRSAAGASPGAPADWRIRVPLNAQYEYAFHSGFFRLNGLSSDDQKVIYMILEQYSGIFRPLYEKICDMCRNTAEVMSMYSKELAILDKNTVMLMMEEQQATIEKQQDTIHEQKDTINKQQVIIDKLQDTVDKQQIALYQQQKTNDELLKNVEELKKAVKALQNAAKNAEA